MGNGHGQNRSIEVGVFFMDCMGLMLVWMWIKVKARRGSLAPCETRLRLAVLPLLSLFMRS